MSDRMSCHIAIGGPVTREQILRVSEMGSWDEMKMLGCGQPWFQSDTADAYEPCQAFIGEMKRRYPDVRWVD